MLLELNIRNIALIERLRIEFGEGLNVLTGETGAGKSIVIDSVNLALGGRADRDLIRAGSDKASVQAVFDVSGNERALALLDEWGFEADDGTLTLGRELSTSGRNICRIGGQAATLTQLRTLTGALVELHGQHEHQELLSPARHLQVLDSFGGEDHRAALRDVREAWSAYSADRTALNALTAALKERDVTMEVLRRQLDDILPLKLRAGEDEALAQRFRLMENAEKIQSRIEKAYNLVYAGSERAPSVQEALKRAQAAMEQISDLDERFRALAGRLDEMYYAAQDVGYELQDLLESQDFDPAAYDKVGARLDAIERLKGRYGPTLDDVIHYRDEAQARLEALSRGDEQLNELKEKLSASEKALRTACEALTARRHALAEAFEKGVIGQLSELGMAKVRFTVRFGAPDPQRLGPTGADEVEFMISPNPGEPLKPLSSTASGGELSRVMLAIKAVIAERDGVGTIIFDEIDTGVSGRMAQAVGEKMSSIGAHRQVIAVSHLPQIAALGDQHFLVEKGEADGRTLTHVRRLDDEGRAMELARLVGGMGDPESSLTHARSMLKGGEAYRAARRAD